MTQSSAEATIQRGSAWWAALVASLVLLGVQMLLPSPADDALRAVAFVLASTAAAAGVRRNQPPHRRAWTAIVAGMWVGTVSQVVEAMTGSDVGGTVNGTTGWLNTVLCGIALTLILGGFLGLSSIGTRSLLRRARVVDTAILAFATSFVVFEVVGRWALTGAERSAGVWVALLYIVVAVAVAFAAMPLILSRSGRPASLLIGLALGLLLLTEVLFVLQEAEVRASTPWSIPLGLCLVAGAAAGLHPSMRRIGTETPGSHLPFTERQLTVSGLALILPAIGIGMVDVLAPGRVGSAADLAAFLIVITVLVTARTRLLVREGRRSDERFRQYFALPLIGMVITEPDGRTLDVNDRLCEMLGRTQAEIVELGLSALVHPDDLDAEQEHTSGLLEGTTLSLVGERRFRRPDGSIVHARCSDHVVTDEDGGVDYVLGLVEDVTEAHLAEQRMNAHLALQNVVLQVAERFVNIHSGDVDQALDRALAEMGRQCDADVAFLLERHGELIATTHAWALDRDGRRPSLISPANDDRPSMQMIRDGHIVVIHSPDELGEGWERERASMRDRGACSVVMVPLVVEDSVLGCIGLSRHRSDARWTPESVDLLRLAAEVFAQALIGRRTATALADSEARNRSVVEAAADGIVTVDQRGAIRTFNPAAEALTGWAAVEVIGRQATMLVAVEHRLQIGPRLVVGPRPSDEHRSDDGDPVRPVQSTAKLELEGLRRDGTHFPLELTMSPVMLPDGPGYTWLARDISDRKALEAQLTHLALHDPLTGLANRILLLDRVGGALRRAERSGIQPLVLFIDLDRFKVINDSLGHKVGDELLMVIAHRLEAELRVGDTAARLGGDEFVALCEGVETAEQAEALADRILTALRQPVQLERANPVVTASIGVVRAALGATPGTLLRDADASMYRAKEQGRNQINHFDESVHGEALERLRLEADIRHALGEGQLRLWLQTQYAVADLRPVGAEALLRWERPGEGVVEPSRFLAVAEEIGFEGEIDRWVLTEACRQARTCATLNPDFVVWVNLSARMLTDPELPSLVRAATAAADLPAANLGIEITERALVRDLDRAAGSLDELRRSGVHIAIDDFGTGFSSLTWLERLPLDVLKIDRSFTAGLGVSREDTVIVRSVIAMAHSLGLAALAEGVETPSQLAQLRYLGCDHFQGHLAAYPMPLEQLQPDAPAPLGLRAPEPAG